jgi:hypothetical protein
MTDLGRLQEWLHGGYRQQNQPPFPGSWRLGNWLSSLRYWAWRLRGGPR